MSTPSQSSQDRETILIGFLMEATESLMQNIKNLSLEHGSRFRTVSKCLFPVLLLCAFWRMLTPLAALANPIWATASLSCYPDCAITYDWVRLMDVEVRERARERPGTRGRLENQLESRNARAAIVSSRIIKGLPEILFFLALALAARRFAWGGVRAGTLTWLRIAAWSAFAWPFAGSIAHALNSYATMPALDGFKEVHVGIYPIDVLVGMSVSGVLWLIIWALDEALRLRKDLDNYV